MRRPTVIRTLLFVVCLAAGASPATGGTLFGLVNTGEIFASSDDGATWSVLAAVTVSDAVAIMAGESSSELLLATRTGTVFYSADAGLSWNAVGAVPASDVVDMLIRPDGDMLLLTETGTLYRSSDGGATFTAAGALTGSNHVSLAADGISDLYVVTSTGEVSRSADEGVTWNQVGAVTTSDAVALRVAGVELYVLTAAGDVARSDDGGVSWTFVGTLSQVHVSDLTWDGDLFAATTTEGLIATSADGMTWKWVGSINQLEVVSLGNDTPTATGIGPARGPLMPELAFDAPWPNPWQSGSGPLSFRFHLMNSSRVTVELYDAAGRLLARRTPAALAESGWTTIAWDVRARDSGVYFVRLSTDTGLHASRKFVVVR